MFVCLLLNCADLICWFRDIKARNAELESSGSNTEPIVLLPLEVMVHPLVLRFKYHFYGNKPTNRLDKVSSEVQVLDTLANYVSLNISCRIS